MATICLNMIVKNESANMRRLYESVKDIIDYYVIVDTGSTDDTKEIIKSFETPGELHEVPWKNFGFNRTDAIARAKGKADYLLLLDADDTLNVIQPDFKEKLDAPAYYIQHTGTLGFVLPRLVKGDIPWHFVGVTHEYIDSGLKATPIYTDAITITHHADGGCRSDKFQRDVLLLLQGLDDEPDNARYMFYLAQSYKDLNQWENAIEWYIKRAQKEGWAEEVWYSLYQIARCKEALKCPTPEVVDAYMMAYDYRPIRAESLYEVGRIYMQQKKYSAGKLYALKAMELPMPREMLFLDRSVYKWKILDLVAVCEYWTGNFTRAYHICTMLLNNNLVPPSELERITKNCNFMKLRCEK